MKATLTTLTLLAALAALPTLPAQDAAPDREFLVYLHENPLHIAPERMSVDVGDDVLLQVKNFNDNPHDLVVCGDAPDGDSACSEQWGFVTLGPQEEGTIRFTATKAGTFEYYCTIPGHKQGGMRGELIVQGASEEQKSVPAPAPLALAGLALAAGLLARRTR